MVLGLAQGQGIRAGFLAPGAGRGANAYVAGFVEAGNIEKKFFKKYIITPGKEGVKIMKFLP